MNHASCSPRSSLYHYALVSYYQPVLQAASTGLWRYRRLLPRRRRRLHFVLNRLLVNGHPVCYIIWTGGRAGMVVLDISSWLCCYRESYSLSVCHVTWGGTDCVSVASSCLSSWRSTLSNCFSSNLIWVDVSSPFAFLQSTRPTDWRTCDSNYHVNNKDNNNNVYP